MSLKVKNDGERAWVTVTDVRNDLKVIYDKVLEQYDEIIVECDSRPVFKIIPPDDTLKVQVEEFE